MTPLNRRIKCQVESLEDRQLPAVMLSLLDNGTTLSIKGDANPEWLNIDQDDELDQLVVNWRTISDVPMGLLKPVATYQSSAIKKIKIDLGGDGDVLSYQLNGNRMRWGKSIEVDLGNGDDAAFIDFGGHLIVPYAQSVDPQSEIALEQPVDWPQPHPADLLAHLAINVSGGAGNDHIVALFGNVTKGLSLRENGNAGEDTLACSVAGSMGSAAPVFIQQDGGAGKDELKVDLGNEAIEANAKVIVNQRGGAGADQLTINAHLPLIGSLAVTQFGGAGDDTINTYALMHWQSTGSLSVRILGESGDDSMTARLKRDDIPPEIRLIAPLKNMRISAVVNGGTGRNVSWITPNVQGFLTQIKKRSWDSWGIGEIDFSPEAF